MWVATHVVLSACCVDGAVTLTVIERVALTGMLLKRHPYSPGPLPGPQIVVEGDEIDVNVLPEGIVWTKTTSFVGSGPTFCSVTS